MRTPRVRRALLGALTLVAVLVLSVPARADVVTDWNLLASKALQAAPAQGGAGQGATSMVHLAMVHGAVYDAVNASSGAGTDAAAATAAYRVLTQTAAPLGIPAGQQAVLAAAYAASLGAVPDGPAKDAGIAAGEAAAAAMMAARDLDGRFGAFRFPVGTLPGQWLPVLPGFVNDPGAWLKDVRPFVLPDASRFRGRRPHDLASLAYARDFAEVKAIGAVGSTLRTDDQTTAARFWGLGNATETWSTLFRAIAAQQGGSVADHARLFARLYTNAADALIVTWGDKNRYCFWRPITAIREAGADGNPATEPDTGWLPLINNPPYPEHPSGLSAVGGAAVETLQDFYGTDRAEFGATNTAGITRSYTRFSQVIDEIVDARVWSGIHFRFADEEGAKIGRRVAHWGSRHAFND
jgi:hypothetical protein